MRLEVKASRWSGRTIIQKFCILSYPTCHFWFCFHLFNLGAWTYCMVFVEFLLSWISLFKRIQSTILLISYSVWRVRFASEYKLHCFYGF